MHIHDSREHMLAEDYPGTEAVTRELLYGLDHMQLMWDQAVYERLAKWLGLALNT